MSTEEQGSGLERATTRTTLSLALALTGLVLVCWQVTALWLPGVYGIVFSVAVIAPFVFWRLGVELMTTDDSGASRLYRLRIRLEPAPSRMRQIRRFVFTAVAVLVAAGVVFGVKQTSHHHGAAKGQTDTAKAAAQQAAAPTPSPAAAAAEPSPTAEAEPRTVGSASVTVTRVPLLAWPVPGADTLSMTKTPAGLDFASAATTSLPVFASTRGVVTSLSGGSANGFDVTIADPDGRSFKYSHLSEALVSSKQHVQNGDVLGFVRPGSPDAPPVVSFAMSDGSGRIDPLAYLPATQSGVGSPQSQSYDCPSDAIPLDPDSSVRLALSADSLSYFQIESVSVQGDNDSQPAIAASTKGLLGLTLTVPPMSDAGASLTYAMAIVLVHDKERVTVNCSLALKAADVVPPGSYNFSQSDAAPDDPSSSGASADDSPSVAAPAPPPSNAASAAPSVSGQPTTDAPPAGPADVSSASPAPVDSDNAAPPPPPPPPPPPAQRAGLAKVQAVPNYVKPVPQSGPVHFPLGH